MRLLSFTTDEFEDREESRDPRETKLFGDRFGAVISAINTAGMVNASVGFRPPECPLIIRQLRLTRNNETGAYVHFGSP